MSDKINFEKRVEDIRTIIGALDGSASGVLVSLLGADIPSMITKFNSAAQQKGESYKGSMKCLDIAAASIADIFRGKTVEEDAWLSDALQKFRDEMARLQQALQDLQNQINALEATVTDLTSKINMYNAEQADWRRVMMSSAWRVIFGRSNTFKSFMDYLAKTSVDDDMSDRAKARIEMYNQLYERLHPQEAASIRTFFENSSKDGITEIDVPCIKFLAYKSENPAHDAFFSNISNCKVISWTYDKTSHYSPKDQGVNMNIAKDRKNSDGSYFTFFHEIGHNMDDLMCNFYNEFDDSGNKTGVIYLSQALAF